MDIYTVANMMKAERKTIFDLDIKVTFYARVSTTREEQENSVEHQIEFFTNMIQDNSNWTFVEGYVDRVRGEKAENRENFMRMIEDGKNGMFDLVLTKEVSRFARNTIDSLTYTRELLRAGVGVFFQNDNICTVDTDSEFRLTIMSSMAADEVRKLSERVRWGHSQSIKNGRVLGNNRIFGYDKVDCRLIINEEEAKMVRLIFELYSTGDYSVRKIERELSRIGYKGRNGTAIHHNTISNIIQNPKYKGYYCGNKVKVVDHRTKEQVFLPKDEWVVFKDDTGEVVPAIVDECVWDKCNAIFSERSEAIRTRERSFKDRSVLTGKIICAVHNKPFWRTSFSNSRNTGHSTYQWICGDKKKNGTKACDTFAIMESDIYEILSDVFKNMLGNIDDYVSEFLDAYKSIKQPDSTKKRISTIESEISKEREKKDKLLELYMDGIINKEEFRDRNNEMGEKIVVLEKELFEITKDRRENDSIEESIKSIKKYLLDMYSDETNITNLQVDEMSKILLDSITVSPISDTAMRLDIKLALGNLSSAKYERLGAGKARSSAYIFLNIWAERRYKFWRNCVRYKSHGHEVALLVRVCT